MKWLLASCEGSGRSHLSMLCWQRPRLIPARATPRLKINPEENQRVGRFTASYKQPSLYSIHGSIVPTLVRPQGQL